MCGATLKEPKTRKVRLPQSDLLVPVLIVAALVLLWLWRPWQDREPQALAPGSVSAAGSATAAGPATLAATVTPTGTPTSPPTATYEVAPTATPLQSPTSPPTPTLPPNQTIHTVESGETVSTIAKKYGTTTSAILQANGLKTNTIISIGQELIIPLPIANTSTPTPTLTPSPTPFVYTIRTGDTLSAVAKRFNTTVEALMQANNIADATRIHAGTQIQIVQPPDYSATMAYAIHEVEQGDTLYTLSGKYGLTVAEIKEINGLTGDNLTVGQKLRIPVGTATPTPTLTAEPTLTPTPGPPYPAPQLLSPPDGTAFEGAGRVILLNWTSVGILAEDEWYAVQVRRSGVMAQLLPVQWTKATSWRLPPELYVGGLDEPQRFYWQVSVMRHTGFHDDGTWLGETISAAGSSRTFTWK